MRVLILGGLTGSGGFCQHLRGILASSRVPADIEVVILGSDELFHALGPLAENVSFYKAPNIANMSKLMDITWWLHVFPSVLRQVSPHVIFDPNGYMPISYADIPSVAMSQNLLPFDIREIMRYAPHKFAMQLLLSRMRHARAFKKAAGVIFVSEYSRNQIMRAVSHIEQSTVIYHGIDSYFMLPEPRAHILHEPIHLLYVSSIHLYKHHASVVKAVQLMRDRLHYDIRLSLIGGGEPIAMRRLEEQISKLNATSYVQRLGKLSIEAVRDAYQSADIFVFASSCEVFGLAVLEAMGMSLPIACSNRGAMSEFLKDGGVYFDPEESDSIASAISLLITNAEKRQQCAYNAWNNAREYSWQRCSEDTFAFLRAVAGMNV